MAGASRRSSRAQSEWNVDTHMPAAVRAEQRLDARPHLLGGLVREGDGEHFVRLRVAVADEVGDAAGDDARLARARAGEDQQRAVGVQHRFALFGIRESRNCMSGLELRGWVPAPGQATSKIQLSIVFEPRP